MKRILALIFLPLLMLVGLTGCTYPGYSGDFPDLYTVAINSVLWNNGHSFGAERYINSQIEIIDEDIYGRIMFTYYEKYYAGADISFSTLVICQHTNENEVFYYEDKNFIVKEQTLYEQNIKDFNNDEIEQLKAENDWNKNINLGKCIKKEITEHKPTIPYENEVKSKIIEEFNLDNERYSLFVNFLTSDSNNDNFIIYGYIRKSNGDDVYFIGLVEKGQELFEKINFLVPLNVFDYKTEFIEFKKINNWI